MKVKFRYIINHTEEKDIVIEVKNQYIDSKVLFDLIKEKENYNHCYILGYKIIK